MKKFFSLLAFFLIYFSYAGVVTAHDIAESGTATLLIHIDPDEVATVGSPETLLMNIKNTEAGFSIAKCNCTFTIEQNEKEIFSSPILPAKEAGEFNALGIPFVFPNAGEYHLGVKGEPKDKGAFTPFELEIHTQVLPAGVGSSENTAAAPTASSATHSPFFLPGIVILIIVIGYAANTRKETKV